MKQIPNFRVSWIISDGSGSLIIINDINSDNCAIMTMKTDIIDKVVDPILTIK